MADLSETVTRSSGRLSATGWMRLRIALTVAWAALPVAAVALGEHSAGRADAALVTIWGLDVPPWLAGIALVYVIALVVCLGRGPEPWRATRWAWFWLSGNPFGTLAYLLLSGPMPGVARPSRRRARLHGGWAFVIGLVVSGACVTTGLR